MKKHLKSVISFVIALAMSLSSVAAFAATYDDVPADAAYAEAVANLTAIGVVEGYGDGKFNPDGNITRAEVATMIVRALAQNDAAQSSMGTTNFTDVAADHWASGYINVASRGSAAFINGMGDGTFAPDANVTYAQVVKMLVAGIGYGDWGVANGGYPTGYIATAKQIGITEGINSVNADDAATRAVVAQLINNAIDTPLLALKTYSPTDPEYVIMDGTDENEYETVLTYYHNIYKVEGRVIATNRTDAGSVDADEVKFQIEVTKNYDDSEVVVKKSDFDEWEEEDLQFTMYLGNTDADEYLNVYAKAMVQIDEDEDATILSFVPSGKNETVSLAGDAWDDEYYDSMEESLMAVFGEGYDDDGEVEEIKPQVWYYADSSKSGKSTRYYLADADELTLYVNGVEMTANESNIQTYVLENATGTITLVDTPSATSSSTDGKYDAIFATYYVTAVVSDVDTDAILFAESDSDIDELVIDEEDEDITYVFVMNGEEIAFTDIKADDIVSIAYNADGDFEDSTFYEVIVARDVAEGKATSIDKDDAEVTIAGTSYKAVPGLINLNKDFTLGTSYEIRLDAFGRIAVVDKLASSVKYGIINRVYASETYDGEYVISMYDTTATKKVYEIADKFVYADADPESTDSDKNQFITEFAGDKITSADDVIGSVVIYETNSSGEIKSIEKEAANGKEDLEYKESKNKIGSLEFDDATVILSADEDGDLSVVSTSSLVDETKYEAYGYDKEDGIYGVIIIADGIGSYTLDTRFAVVNKVSQGLNDDEEEVDKIALYTAGSKDLQVINSDTDGMFYGKLNKGDVIIYKTNAAGVIESTDDVEVIFSAGDEYVNYAETKVTADLDAMWKMPTRWVDNDEDVTIKFGPIIEKSASGLTIGQVVAGEDGNLTATEENYADGTEAEFFEYGFDSDVAVYVYDFDERESNRLSVGTIGSIKVANFLESHMVADAEGDDTVIDWSNDKTKDSTYALVKLVDEDITDILVIIPESK